MCAVLRSLQRCRVPCPWAVTAVVLGRCHIGGYPGQSLRRQRWQFRPSLASGTCVSLSLLLQRPGQRLALAYTVCAAHLWG